MTTLDAAKKAIKDGVNRAGCQLMNVVDKQDDLDIHVQKDEQSPITIIGREYDYKNISTDDIATRAYRFCLHYIHHKNYYHKWGDSLV